LGFSVDDEDTPGHVADRVHPDDLLGVLELIEQVRSTPGMEASIRCRARHRDGSWRIIEASVIETSHDGRLGPGAVVRSRDVTELVTGQNDPGDHFRSLADAVPSGILSADSLGWVVFTNEAASQILDLPGHALHGRGWESVIHPEDGPDVVSAAGAVLGASNSEQVNFRVRSQSGERWVHARFLPLRSDVAAVENANRRMGWIATLDDITDRRRMESQLAHRATHDPLTGLPNRALLDDRLEQACARLRRDDDVVAVLFIDLDDFKGVNDRHDHRTGDQVLQEVARRLRQVLRPADTAARLGGDEFVAVCESTDEEEATEIAGRLREALGVPFLVGGKRLALGASVGVACSRGDGCEPADLLLRADQAMYRQKRRRAS
jgi:diguanylate cyclase (GGDEF)-like protein/PAS domain S-box-containing protein